MYYFFEGTARHVGALGITHHFCAVRHAETREAAERLLYDEFEHIHLDTCTEREEA